MNQMTKRMLVLVASEDVQPEEVNNITSQVKLYGIEHDRFDVHTAQDLYNALNYGYQYDYIYLATHGCDVEFGNVSGSLKVTWLQFAAMVCNSGCNKQDAIFLHSCCRGGLSQVAWKMFNCCNKIAYVCGPRNNISPVDLVTAFNLFLYNVEVRRIDPVVAAEKVLGAIDTRLVCYDRLDAESDAGYINHCELNFDAVQEAFNHIDSFTGEADTHDPITDVPKVL
jgi:hypothetical protein